MAPDRFLNRKPYVLQEFKTFNSQDREIIYASIQDRSNPLILSKTVEDYIYATTRALDFGDYYDSLKKGGLWEHAVNKNSDYFDISELEEVNPAKKIARYQSFRTAGMYKNHESDKIENAIGLVFDSVMMYDPYEDMHVTTLFGIDKKKASAIGRDLEKYATRVAVSMGCSIEYSICTACGKEIHKEADTCECLRFSRGRRREGKKVAEFLKGVDFFELSIVSSPAAPTAYVIDAISEIIPGRLLKVATEKKDYASLDLMNTIYGMIRQANTIEEKKRLSNQFDRLIAQLEKSYEEL